uniref:Uncharacterized protein n=1 Tax=Arundo donax TaxID=35708 RepID=A0A0A8ZTA5_ARUDO
MLPQARFLGF